MHDVNCIEFFKPTVKVLMCHARLMDMLFCPYKMCHEVIVQLFSNCTFIWLSNSMQSHELLRNLGNMNTTSDNIQTLCVYSKKVYHWHRTPKQNKEHMKQVSTRIQCQTDDTCIQVLRFKSQT